MNSPCSLDCTRRRTSTVSDLVEYQLIIPSCSTLTARVSLYKDRVYPSVRRAAFGYSYKARCGPRAIKTNRDNVNLHQIAIHSAGCKCTLPMRTFWTNQTILETDLISQIGEIRVIKPISEVTHVTIATTLVQMPPYLIQMPAFKFTISTHVRKISDKPLRSAKNNFRFAVNFPQKVWSAS